VKRIDTTSTRWSMWFAFLVGPIAWAVHETLSYAFVKLACGSGLLILEYVVTLLCVAVVAIGGYLSRGAILSRTPVTSAEFIYLSALVLNILFGFAIILEALPNLVVNPCL
jgi:hypothetical protein